MFPQVQTSVATFPFTISLLSEVSSAPPPQLSDTCGSHSSLTCQSCSPHGCPTISNLQVQHQTHHILLPLLHLPKAPGFHLPVTKAWKFRHPELLILQCLSSHQIHRSFFLSISCSIFPNAFPTLSPLVKLSSYGRSSCQSALSSCTLPFDQLQDVSLDDQPHKDPLQSSLPERSPQASTRCPRTSKTYSIFPALSSEHFLVQFSLPGISICSKSYPSFRWFSSLRVFPAHNKKLFYLGQLSYRQ